MTNVFLAGMWTALIIIIYRLTDMNSILMKILEKL